MTYHQPVRRDIKRMKPPATTLKRINDRNLRGRPQMFQLFRDSLRGPDMTGPKRKSQEQDSGLFIHAGLKIAFLSSP